ncbi:TPA: preprotein translocase subunit TatC [Candidatus Geothermarchaeota archaeon]|nr:preprotein translocase subunit TatC [Candidatus Geothermarchaeota archaeon]HIQ13743.1 preprotein translocase subunit TatC [Thermoprotei archaeon]
MSVEEELEEELTFWDHLSELLIRLRRVVIFGFISMVTYLIMPASIEDLSKMVRGEVYNPLSLYLLERVRSDLLEEVADRVELIPATFAAPIELYFQAALVLGIVTTLPYLAYEIYMFLEPGLYPHEKKFLKRFIFGFSFSFLIGALYGYYVIMPITFRILLLFSGLLDLTNFFNVTSFYELVFLGVVSTGFVFTLPVFLVLAFKFQVLDPNQLANIRRYLYFGVFFITAVLTPDPTPISMILISLPFIILFEISIWIGRKVYAG